TPAAGAVALAGVRVGRGRRVASGCARGRLPTLRAGRNRPCPQASPLRADPGRILAVGGRPYMGAGRGWLPLLVATFAAKM
ncbi:hypothetical protein GW17_00025875, partial [Ensete ventricosum]